MAAGVSVGRARTDLHSEAARDTDRGKPPMSAQHPVDLHLPGDPPVRVTGDPSWLSLTVEYESPASTLILGHECLSVLIERLRVLGTHERQDPVPEDPTDWTWVATLSDPLRALYVRPGPGQRMTLWWQEAGDGSAALFQTVSAEQLRTWLVTLSTAPTEPSPRLTTHDDVTSMSLDPAPNPNDARQCQTRDLS